MRLAGETGLKGQTLLDVADPWHPPHIANRDGIELAHTLVDPGDRKMPLAENIEAIGLSTWYRRR